MTTCWKKTIESGREGKQLYLYNKRELISVAIEEKIKLINQLANNGYMEEVIKVVDAIVKALLNGRKVLTAGNGGSAADAQHFTGELVGRFLKERGALAAVSLVVDPVVITSLGNDYGYDHIIARQVEGIGNNGDVFFAISTSGNSPNICNALLAAKKKGIVTVGLTGKGGGRMSEMCDYNLIVPSDQTPRIQEIHTFTVHLLCEMIETDIFGVD